MRIFLDIILCLFLISGAWGATTASPDPVWHGNLTQFNTLAGQPTAERTRFEIGWLAQEVAHPTPTSTGMGGAPIDSDYIQAQFIISLGQNDREQLRAAREAATDPAVREDLTIALVYGGDPTFISEDIAILQNNRGKFVRAQAAIALRHFDRLEVIAALQRALQDPATLTFVKEHGIGQLDVGKEVTVYPVREGAQTALQEIDTCTFPPPSPAGTMLNFWVEGGIKGGPQYALRVDLKGTASFRSYSPLLRQTVITFTPNEMEYLRSFIAPLSGLVGKPISRGGADVFTHTLTIVGYPPVELTWQLTEQPDVLAFMNFVDRIRLLVIMQQALEGNNLLAIINTVNSLPDLQEQVFRPRELAPALWRVVSLYPLIELTEEENRDMLVQAVVTLSALELHEEWAGHVMRSVERVRITNASQQWRMVNALAWAVVNTPDTPNVPWRYLTAFFIQNYQWLISLPAEQRTPEYKETLTQLTKALTAIDDPRAQAIVGGGGGTAAVR